FVVSLSSLLSGCSSKLLENNVEPSLEKAESEKVSSSLAESSIYSYGNFSHGYAWIDWENYEDGRQASLINKKGQIVYLNDLHDCLEDKNDKVLGIPLDTNFGLGTTIEFYEDYAWCRTNGDYYIVNTDLEILGKISSTENKKITAVGGKYYLALVTEEDFDHREQYLAIYDYTDKLIVRTEDCDPESYLFYYLGKGIFCFENSKGKAFLLTTSGILKEYPSTFHPNFVDNSPTCFEEGATQALLTCSDSYGDTICIIDQDGTFQTVSLKDCYGTPGINAKGLVLYYASPIDSPQNLTAISKDITKLDETYQLNDNLSKRLFYQLYIGTHYQFNEKGICALTFKGADEKDYIGIFDSKFNQIGDMIQGMSRKCYFEDGLLVIYLEDGTSVAYNEKGKKEFEFPKGTHQISLASDGVFAINFSSKVAIGDLSFSQNLFPSSEDCVSPDEVYYLTTEGKRLFDTITVP
ncbi:MAG: hypothetical protein K2H85_01615, partial [Allobaculum sp.]|nr:hypothetical protein [Allobaculum sp.]